MKKFLVFLVAALLAAMLPVTAFADGGICGVVLNSDIKAYVDGLPIKSYNIDGWTGVVAEDLRGYGFDVEWDGEQRTLTVYKIAQKNYEITADYQFEENTEPVGSRAAYVYETDIKTYVAGNEVAAFNIGGRTIIYIDELADYGDVVWDENARTIAYTYREPWRISLKPSDTGVQHQGNYPYEDEMKQVSGQFVKNDGGAFEMQGEGLGHLSWIELSFDKRYTGLQFGFSMVAHHLLADFEFSELCHDMLTINYDGVRMQKKRRYSQPPYENIYQLQSCTDKRCAYG